MNNPKAIVLTVLSRHIGKGNGISMRGLEQQLDMLPRQIRHHISDLREEGRAICGTPNHGYYIAATAEELGETIEFHDHRARHELKKAGRLRRMLGDLYGQTSIPNLTN